MADIIYSGCDHHQHPRSRTRIMDDNIGKKFIKFVPDHHHVAESSSSSSSVLLLVPPSKRQKLVDMIITTPTPTPTPPLLSLKPPCLDIDSNEKSDRCPKFSSTAVCGRRREMEDAVAIHPSFYCWRKQPEEEEDHHQDGQRFHFFGLYDGHGCSHVAMNCKDRLHHLVKEELNREESTVLVEWKEVMERSFDRMDKEVLLLQQSNINTTGIQLSSSCKCELQLPQCEAVGSTAVVSIVTSDKVIVANCGDSRAILCRDGKAVPLSVDHKPDLPEELNRIEEAGGRVIYWDGPRVLGVLAMSRAIGDNYLKPYVSSVPEITVTERTEEDEFLIMGSDGLWDVVSNDTACGIVRMCLSAAGKSPIFKQPEQKTSSVPTAKEMFGEEKMDRRCSDAAMLLSKLALARRSCDNVSVVVVDLRSEKKKKKMMMMMN